MLKADLLITRRTQI